MEMDELKRKFIELEKEYIEYVLRLFFDSKDRTLSWDEKVEIYRTCNKYIEQINECVKEYWLLGLKSKAFKKRDFDDLIAEFPIKQEIWEKIDLNDSIIRYLLQTLMIDMETGHFKLTFYSLSIYRNGFKMINIDLIMHGQKIIDKPVYILTGYYDRGEDCYGPCFGDLIDAIYKELLLDGNSRISISRSEMEEFERDKIIINFLEYINYLDIERIFREELLNEDNKNLDDCINRTKVRIIEENYLKSPMYREKVLLERIREMFKKIKGSLIEKDILFKGNFLEVLKECYQLPNQRIISKEKIVKNNGKNAVVVIAMTKDNKYILTVQNRIEDELLVEFPSGYIEDNEDVLDAAKRELLEETGYEALKFELIDSVYTSPGIDNSMTYIVIANYCSSKSVENNPSNEVLEYGLFSELELEYMINNNLINGAINRLAYYEFKFYTYDRHYYDGLILAKKKANRNPL